MIATGAAMSPAIEHNHLLGNAKSLGSSLYPEDQGVVVNFIVENNLLKLHRKSNHIFTICQHMVLLVIEREVNCFELMWRRNG
jgi:hypothetical protein